MGKLLTVLLWFLLTLRAASAQTVNTERALPNWLTGIIAVAVFLFLVFVAFVVNKAWCQTPSQERKFEVTTSEYVMTNGSNLGTNLESVRSSEHYEAYENVLVHKAEEKVTAM